MISPYHEAGGSPVLRVAVDDLYRRVRDDPDTAPYFIGVDLVRLAAHQRAFLATALGGPQPYGGRDLAAAHAGLHVDDRAYDALVLHLVSALRDLGVRVAPLQAIAERLEGLRPLVVDAPSGEMVPGGAVRGA
ncbi:MAG TPA: group 1 truncated hemoglobin [Pilimelia sp.]|nr:group 1 truncated hemoglobin [Pilimelia sp.]